MRDLKQEERSGGLTGADRSRADRKRDQPTDMNVVENSRKDLQYTMHEGKFGNWGNMSSRESCRLELARRTAGQGRRVVEREERASVTAFDIRVLTDLIYY